MVRREEQPWQSRATVFVDNRSVAHEGEGSSSSFERAVAAAASVAMHLVSRGYRVRLVTADPTGADAQQWHEHGVTASESAPLLESLAVLQQTGRQRIDAAWAAGERQGGVVVALLADCTLEDFGALRSLRHSADHALALQLEVAPSGAAVPDEALGTSWLVAHGWRAATLGRDESLPEVWRGLGAARSAVAT
jgi:uncharacterized protein (DUF58 family)